MRLVKTKEGVLEEGGTSVALVVGIESTGSALALCVAFNRFFELLSPSFIVLAGADVLAQVRTLAQVVTSSYLGWPM